MVRIPTTQQGILDMSVLEENLDYYSKLNRRIICSLNAASNITGILTDVDAVSALVHSYEGLIFWDYATAAPYVQIDMNPSSAASKDAIFISTHKFVGGPGSPGESTLRLCTMSATARSLHFRYLDRQETPVQPKSARNMRRWNREFRHAYLSRVQP